jgi:putative sugar O-methyltransferase
MQQNRIADQGEILDAFRAMRPPTKPTFKILCEMYVALLEEAQSQSALGWRPVGGEIRKSEIALTPEKLEGFAGYNIGGIGFEGPYDFLMEPGDLIPLGDPIEITPERLERHRSQSKIWSIQKLKQLATLAPGFEDQWMALTQEVCPIGGPQLHLNRDWTPFPITHHGLRVAYRAPALANWISRPISRLIEIGGGHGRFIRDAALLMPDAKLILTDLPFNLIISARYLIGNFGRQVNLCFLPDQKFDPDSRINIIAPWRLSEISVPVDTACNFLSFQHMDETNLEWYGKAMRDLQVQSLFQVNRNAVRDPFDKAIGDYPFMTEFEADQRQVLDVVKYINGNRPDSRVTADLIIELAHRRE